MQFFDEMNKILKYCSEVTFDIEDPANAEVKFLSRMLQFLQTLELTSKGDYNQAVDTLKKVSKDFFEMRNLFNYDLAMFLQQQAIFYMNKKDKKNFDIATKDLEDFVKGSPPDILLSWEYDIRLMKLMFKTK